MHRVPLFTILGLGLTLGGCNGANTSESASESAGATDSSSRDISGRSVQT